jgi:hypothetical protein
MIGDDKWANDNSLVKRDLTAAVRWRLSAGC